MSPIARPASLRPRTDRCQPGLKRSQHPGPARWWCSISEKPSRMFPGHLGLHGGDGLHHRPSSWPGARGHGRRERWSQEAVHLLHAGQREDRPGGQLRPLQALGDMGSSSAGVSQSGRRARSQRQHPGPRVDGQIGGIARSPAARSRRAGSGAGRWPPPGRCALPWRRYLGAR